MKRSLITLSSALLLTATVATAQSFSTEEKWIDRSLPTYPELGLSTEGIQVADGYRFNAGDSKNELVVQHDLG